LTYDQAWDLFKASDFSREKPLIVVENPKSGIEKIFSCFYASLDTKHLLERETIFCIAKREVDLQDDSHMSMMRGIFMQLTKENFCPVYGAHWKKIGFQSEDTSRDFRAAGLLGPLQLCYLLTRMPRWAESIYQHSITVEYNYPFAISQFEITMFCLHLARSGKLLSFANSSASYGEFFHTMYLLVTALFYFEYTRDSNDINKYNDIMDHVKKTFVDRSARMISKLQQSRLLVEQDIRELMR